MHYYASDKLGFEFRGSAREWFGIWIVNLLLSIVTLGIYSAWAKVRAKKYFYQNTYVAGRNFDYHATGMQIFLGRLIVIVGLIFYSVASSIPLVGLNVSRDIVRKVARGGYASLTLEERRQVGVVLPDGCTRSSFAS